MLHLAESNECVLPLSSLLCVCVFVRVSDSVRDIFPQRGKNSTKFRPKKVCEIRAAEIPELPYALLGPEVCLPTRG